uniref:Uncharacterized protein n=1 Tax=Chromera velia CCMP2878 TaxID=1169474 RepID=A0A0G4GQB1_9ALVE|eukprot:Cvel_22904.t1-p1 / transcript=Cvel_22904.t1 / gene=Cvel_22904 / organism=Chromera_velia_CCMP2878 / gene_product=hypothetical protein / transcript_product=hypothetical protein / location=Cvel_scaffold2301:25277-27877(-) / protein_length=367 / sequence_SO=supercontig / SO=protein_coding / is_pseudo=false
MRSLFCIGAVHLSFLLLQTSLPVSNALLLQGKEDKKSRKGRKRARLPTPKDQCPVPTEEDSPTDFDDPTPEIVCTKLDFCKSLQEMDRRATLQFVHYSKEKAKRVYIPGRGRKALEGKDIEEVRSRANFYSSGKPNLYQLRPNEIFPSNAAFAHVCSPALFTRMLTPSALSSDAESIASEYGIADTTDFESDCASARKELIGEETLNDFDTVMTNFWCPQIFSVASLSIDGGMCQVPDPRPNKKRLRVGLLDCDVLLAEDPDRDTEWSAFLSEHRDEALASKKDAVGKHEKDNERYEAKVAKRQARIQAQEKRRERQQEREKNQEEKERQKKERMSKRDREGKRAKKETKSSSDIPVVEEEEEEESP